MGRKSLAYKRQEEIIDAFETCIEKYGFANSSTRKIAEEAGIKQPMISHYFGGKNALVKALVSRITNQYLIEFQNATKNTAGEMKINKILDYLFGPELLGPESKGNLIGQLISASTNDVELRAHIKSMYDFFIETGKAELGSLFPDKNSEALDNCTYGILCLAVGNDALLSIDIPFKNRIPAKKCAELLIESLK